MITPTHTVFKYLPMQQHDLVSGYIKYEYSTHEKGCDWFTVWLMFVLLSYYFLTEHTTGCLQLLEIPEISLKLYGPLGNFCVTCRWSTALVFNHDETGYWIAYLRNWSPFLSLPWPYVVHIMFLFCI